MQFTFIQLNAFLQRWKHFRLSDDDLRALEDHLLRNPESGATMAGTGGLRKMRFSPPSRHSGKSGAYRIAYALFTTAGMIVFVSIFAK